MFSEYHDIPQLSMESTKFSPEAVKESLFQEGFFYLEDLAVGEGILEMEKRGFEYFSEYGLNFCKQHILNARIMSIAESFFGDETCILAHWLRYTAYPGHILCFRRGGPKAGRCVLVVHLLSQRITSYLL
ncbi:5398761d-2153-434d-b04a-641ca121d054 [Sclerotinia trifoliorum]|uniref:5398761d-2153-434d-b04a-641ca121d054 n=1 Tax=Sclerotinia trifoliorum TaxID=28548 RepID=A0A8H2VW95_9HELO|nr:5398761d-2153-434d-b04a-641ca121d054 [Sclerotinia trifoliorum]